MFYPKSQIKTNLYTNGGEYVYASDNKPYIGDYFIVGDGTVYTGRNPNDKPNNLLILNKVSEITPSRSGSEFKPQSYYLVDDYYYYAKGEDTIPPPTSLPIQIFPVPTEEEYNIGEIQRYFVKKINENKYIEVSKDEYERYENQDINVSYQQYSPFTFPWVITGKRANAYTVNKNTVKRVETENQIQGLSSYFKNKYDQLFKYSDNENLYTDGTEFRSSLTGKPYIGFYHIHPDKGPMEGPQHIDEPHGYLIPISKTYEYETTSSSYVTQSWYELRYGGLNAPVFNPLIPNPPPPTPPDPNAFITIWRTTSAFESITMGLDSSFSYLFRVNWGDGNEETISSNSNLSHTYDKAGDYTVLITGTFPRIQMNKSGATPLKLIEIKQWGSIVWSRIANAFDGCRNLYKNRLYDTPDLTSLTTADSIFMFRNCGTNSPNLLINNIDNWDVSGIRRMGSMFRGSKFQGISINNWDVSNVTNFANMFQDTPLFNEPLNGWDTSSGRYFGSMFAGTALFNQPLSNFVFSNTIGINFMFFRAQSFNQPIGNWDVSTITSMKGTFNGAVSFDQDISNWDITNVGDFRSFLRGVRLSNTNYDNLLIGWEATLQASYPGGAGYTPPIGQVDFGNSQYKVGTTARTSLISNFGWNITDGGPQ